MTCDRAVTATCAGLRQALCGLAAAVATGITGPAVSAQPQIERDVVSHPTVGVGLWGAPFEKRSSPQSTPFNTFTEVTGGKAVFDARPQPCPEQSWRSIVVRDSGWIGLDLSVAPGDEVAHIAWLQDSSPLDATSTNSEVINRALAALEQGLDALAGAGAAGKRSARVNFKARIVPDDCRYVEVIRHSVAQARKVIDFPIAWHSPGLAAPPTSIPFQQQLVRLAAHETVHVFQLHPYERSQWRAVRVGWAKGEWRDLGHERELRALMVDRCLAQAVLPNDWYGESLGQTWRDRPKEFGDDAKGSKFGTVFKEFFSRQQKILGHAFVNARSDEQLAKLFPYCAMYMQRPGAVSASAKPTAAERVDGLKALGAIRSLTGPLFFPRHRYSDSPLP